MLLVVLWWQWWWLWLLHPLTVDIFVAAAAVAVSAAAAAVAAVCALCVWCGCVGERRILPVTARAADSCGRMNRHLSRQQFLNKTNEREIVRKRE